MKEFNLKRIEDAFAWLQKEFEDTDVQQSIDALDAKQGAINSVVAWAYEQMAVAKYNLNTVKEAAYIELSAKAVSLKQIYSPSLAKDYISAKCATESYSYDLTERLCRACVHISDNLRTSISAMKEMAKMENYANTQY